MNGTTFTARGRLRGYRMAVTLLSGGSYNVGINGWLLQTCDTPWQAVSVCQERIRMLTGGLLETPKVSPAFRAKVLALPSRND